VNSIASLCCPSTHLHISGPASLAKFAGKFGSMHDSASCLVKEREDHFSARRDSSQCPQGLKGPPSHWGHPVGPLREGVIGVPEQLLRPQPKGAGPQDANGLALGSTSSFAGALHGSAPQVRLGAAQATRKLNDRKLTVLSPVLLSVYC
jgi:hypothetical protein